jgi:hypothetical protein
MQGQGLGDWPCALTVCQPDAFFNQTFNYDVWLTHSDSDAADEPERMTADALVESVGSCDLGLTKKVGQSEPESCTEQDREQSQCGAKKHVKLGISQTP